MPHVSVAGGGGGGGGGDDFASSDEVKVYEDEGDEEQRSSENLSEDKLGLVTETEERKSSDLDVQNGYSTDENSSGTNNGVKLPEYPIPERLPFGYPLIPPYPYLNGPTLVSSPGKLFPPHPGLGFYMYQSDSPLSQPPPAHMGIPPLQIDPKTGLPRHSMYGLPSSPGHLPHPLYPPDFSPLHGFDMLTRSSSTAAFCSSYPTSMAGSPLAWFGPSRILPPHPGFPYSALNHPALVNSGIKQESSPLSESVENCRDCHPLPRCKLNGMSHHVSQVHHRIIGGVGDLSQEKKRPYIKKPLNAYMLFMKSMRQRVIDECTLKESAAINQILGRKWHALDRAEQQKYYDMARKEKELHLQLYPGWSARDNYATHTKKKKRKHDSNINDEKITKDSSAEETDCPNNRKCRTRFGLEQQNQWCKSCRDDINYSSVYKTSSKQRSDYRYLTEEDGSETDETNGINESLIRCLPTRYSYPSDTEPL